MHLKATYIPQKISLRKKINIKIFQFFKLSNSPSLNLYTGFGNGNNFVLYGHALSLSPLQRKSYRQFFLFNAVALLRLFMVKPLKNSTVKLLWENEELITTTENDGFFKFEWTVLQQLPAGTYSVKALLIKKGTTNKILANSEANIVVPAQTNYNFISDIDDTFLISHSGNLRKRLFVLLTENAHSRIPFDGAVKHYRFLHAASVDNPSTNAFFYVSSSEWNLYGYIKEFIQQQKLPDGVFLLNHIKTFSKLFSTGQNNHNEKFTRIVKIIEMYPLQKFILLGDDSQKDIDIYSAIVEHFPQNIYCIYIRMLHKLPKSLVIEKQKFIEKKGIHFLYFPHSEVAIEHSKSIGLM